MSRDDLAGVILAGGSSRRLGTNKALAWVDGQTLIGRVAHSIKPLVDEIIIVTNDAASLGFMAHRCVADLCPGSGVLGGVHAGLAAMAGDHALVVGCDMPFLSADLLGHMISLRSECDVVMPRVGNYYEPLHAIYSRQCLPVFEAKVVAGERRILRACEGLRVRFVEQDRILELDPRGLSFFNVNTPSDLARMQELIATS